MLLQPNILPVKENGKRYQLMEDYRYGGILVPKGFRYDGASVPRVFMFLIGLERDGIHRPAALVHDYLYQNGGYIESSHKVTKYNRKDADLIFYDMLKLVGVKSWHAKAAYLAVRVGGSISWRNK